MVTLNTDKSRIFFVPSFSENLQNYLGSEVGGDSDWVGDGEIEGAEESSITGTLSSFLANKKESNKENKIKLRAITLVVLVRISALDEPKAV
jgi:hypothetical protein